MQRHKLNLNPILYIMILLNIFSNIFGASSKECGLGDWQCDDGGCIDEDDFCNGKVNCADGSDETVANCISTSCPDYAFRCSYGGCISKSKKCNQVQDCADNSDELIRMCGDELQKKKFNLQVKGICDDDQIQCNDSLDCIDEAAVCDGYKHCSDGSDESVELCFTTICAGYLFKCGYGACVSKLSVCNDTVECWDGSDEDWQLCGKPKPSVLPSTVRPMIHTIQTKITTMTTTSTTTTTTPASHITIFPERSCRLPHLLLAKHNSKNILYKDFIPNKTFFKLECPSGYVLDPPRISGYCNDGNSTIAFPECKKQCPPEPIFRSFSTQPNCTKPVKGGDIRRFGQCNKQRLLVGTIVKFQCAPYYYSDVSLEDRECLENGQWSYSRPSCSMACGVSFKSEQFSTSGVPTNSESEPWHAAIYEKSNYLNYNYTCSGTIISPLVIATAAHCFYNRRTKSFNSPESFEVIVGKNNRDYYAEEVDMQKLRVKKIIPYDDFDYDQQLKNDLALVILDEHMTFNNVIRPACRDNIKTFGDTAQDSNISGYMMGWGKHNDSSIDYTLQKIGSIQYGYRDCWKRGSVTALTPDKFCVDTTIGRPCRGDSGSGYFVEMNGRIFLRGILSNAFTDTEACSVGDVLLVNIFHFLEWIDRKIKTEHKEYLDY